MIKKVLIFVVLLTIGFVTLYLLVEPQNPASASGHHSETPPKLDENRTQGPGIPIETNDDNGTKIIVKPGGEVYLPKNRRIEMPSGSFRVVPVYVLHAKNSHTEPGNRLALEDVTIEFFAKNTQNSAKRKPLKTATMTAGKAVIELSRDENQISQIAEDKLMEFWDIVYTAGDGGRVRNTKITVGRAQAINTADMIHLWTPDRHEPVHIESQGKDGFVVTGEGLDAWVPSSRNDKGEVQLKNVGVKDITVLHNPLLAQDDTTLQSKGPLRLKEDSRTETILITMRDSVAVTSQQSSLRTKASARIVSATGDDLRAIISRLELRDRSEMYWRSIDLRGKPARMTDRQDLDLTCRHISVLPDPTGRPFWITAEGDETIAPVMKHVVDGKTNTYRCAGKVHLIELARQHAFFLQSYGIPGGLPPEFDQLILFDGKVSIDSPQDGLKMSSSRGIQLFRSANKDLRDYAILRGQGDVRVTSAVIKASGNRGFVLHQWPEKTRDKRKKTELVRVFRLGPQSPDTSHRYDVRRLASTTTKKAKKKAGNRRAVGFHIVGSGFCKILMRGQIAEEAHLSSLAEDLDAKMTGSAGHLWQVRTLDAWFSSDGTPMTFVARGKDCRLEFETKDGVVSSKAEEIQHSTVNTYRLLGNLAEARLRSYGTLRGRDISIEQLTDRDVRLRASSRAELRVIALPNKRRDQRTQGPRNAGEPNVGRQKRDVRFTLRANEIRAEPLFIHPSASMIQGGLFPRTIETEMDSRYLFAKGKVTFDYQVKEAGRIDSGHGAGDELTLRSDRERMTFTEGRLLGKPAKIVSVDFRGRETDAESNFLWFLTDKDGQYVTLHKVGDHLPVLRMLGLPRTQSGQPERMMLTCDGDIEMDPRTVRCAGPVTVRGLDLRGSIDPHGYMLDGKSMVMARSDSGEVTSVTVAGDVDFHWVDADGKCDELAIDMQQTILTAKGITRPAVVTTPSGKVHLSQVNYNYRTKMAETWKWRVLTKR